MSSSGNYSRKRKEPSRRSESIKKKWKSGTQLPHIPEEILVTILSKLPIKSLLRFKCVSKPWRSLISNKKFNLSSPKQQVIVMSKYYDSLDCTLHLINDEALSVEVPKPKQLKVRGGNLIWELTIRGSCNGLVLLSNSVDLFLWNPSTRCCRVLSHKHLTTFDHCHNASGLCYDSSTDDYKVVMACWGWSRERDDDKVMVGSFRYKTWTEVCFPYDKRGVKSGPTVHERLHWLVTKSTSSMDETNLLVVGFDQRTNKFMKVPIPKIKKEKLVLCLGALDGSLALWTDYRRHNGSEVEIFVMKKYGDQASWTSLFVISNVEHLSGRRIWVPLCVTKNGEVKMQPEVAILGRISVYNPEFNSFRHIQIAAYQMMRCETYPFFFSSKAVTFVESFVSPPNNNWEEEEECTETFLSGVMKKWKRGPGDIAFKVTWVWPLKPASFQVQENVQPCLNVARG